MIFSVALATCFYIGHVFKLNIIFSKDLNYTSWVIIDSIKFESLHLIFRAKNKFIP